MTVTTADGARLESGPVTTRGDPATPLSETEITDKLRAAAPPGAGPAAANLAALCLNATPDQPAAPLVAAVLSP